MRFEDLTREDQLELDRQLEAEREAQAYEQEERLAGRFTDRFEKRSWLERFAEKRRRAIIESYLWQVISAAAAGYSLYLLFQIIPFGLIAISFTLGAIFIHEREKRRWSDKFWDSFHANRRKIAWLPLGINALLFLISFSVSVGGGYFGIKDNTPGATYMGLTSNPHAAALQGELAQLESEIVDFENNPSNKVKDHGQMVIQWDLRDDLAELKNRRLAIKDELLEKYDVVDTANEEIKAAWHERREFIIWFGILLLVIGEVRFEMCMSFCSKYDYRKFRALQILRAKREQLERERADREEERRTSAGRRKLNGAGDREQTREHHPTLA